MPKMYTMSLTEVHKNYRNKGLVNVFINHCENTLCRSDENTEYRDWKFNESIKLFSKHITRILIRPDSEYKTY